MPALAAKRDPAPPEESPSVRRRAVRAASFVEPTQADAERERAELLSTLAGVLQPLADATGDAAARAIAEEALGWFQGYRAIVVAAASGRAAPDAALGGEALDVLARLEDAFERMAATAQDEGTRAIAEDTLALYRGR